MLVAAWMFTTFYVAAPAHAQCTFSSGSTGADGAFTPTNSMPSTGWSISNSVVTVTNSANGIFNFTSVYIETNWIVKFTKNTLNTPVYILAQSNVTIKGTIDLNGRNADLSPGYGPGIGGPGGFDGGRGGTPDGGYGSGPGGGGQNGSGGNGASFAEVGVGWGGSYAAPTYGTLDIQPFIGGSGGGGDGDAQGGGGGGGAVLIASSMTMDASGTITANAGTSPSDGSAGNGSGGSIRLIANTIQGEGAVTARGIPANRVGSPGRIHIEGCTNKRISLTDPPATFGGPNVVFLATNPTIRITSVAGMNVAWPPAGLLNNPDTNLPSAFTNPAAISVSASNINVGTTFKVIVTPVYGTNRVATSTLAGSYAFSSGIVTMAIYTDRVWRVNAMIDYIPRP